MVDAVDIWERPQSRQVYMLAGWRQWADAGATSSGLPEYLIQQTGARRIGTIRPDGFYLFQITGTHDLVRPVVRFNQGYPEALEVRRNELYYTGDDESGTVIFLGDEPHLDVERYAAAFLHAAKILNVKRVVGFGGVYGELPFDKERMVSGIYSLPELKTEMSRLAVNLSDYHGGASIGSYLCRRAGDQGREFVALYAFVPTYELTGLSRGANTIRIENDFMAWLGIMRRVNYMLKTRFDLADLEKRSAHLIQFIDSKVGELDRAAPQLGIRDYIARLSEGFTEMPFEPPLGNVWEDELRRIFDDFDSKESGSV